MVDKKKIENKCYTAIKPLRPLWTSPPPLGHPSAGHVVRFIRARGVWLAVSKTLDQSFGAEN